MAVDITNPAANANEVRFSNEEIRPLAEAIRALKARCNSVRDSWFVVGGGSNGEALNVAIPNDATVLNDGRAAEGITQITGEDINSMMVIIDHVATNAIFNDQVLEKPTVRPLNAD